MLTVFDVRRQLAEIERLSLHPMRKARKLLAIARLVRREARKLGHGVAILSRDCMDDQAERLRKAMQRLADLNREVMDRARQVLADARHPGPAYEPIIPFPAQPMK